jgi:hypothetical protein
MEIFESLMSAKEHGQRLAKVGQTPSIYQRDYHEFILLASRETPPPRAFPFLKWVGRMSREAEESEWVPILARLDSINRAKEACALFYLLGYGPIIVEYQTLGIYDIFLREDDIPPGAWIVIETDDDYDLREIQPSPFFYDEDDEPEFEVSIDNM